MPQYRVTSGEITPTNGSTPYSKRVWAFDALAASKKAIPLGKGKIAESRLFDSDLANLRYTFFVTTTKGTSFKVVVEEIFRFNLFKFFKT